MAQNSQIEEVTSQVTHESDSICAISSRPFFKLFTIKLPNPPDMAHQLLDSPFLNDKHGWA